MAEITVETILEYIGRLSAADRVKPLAVVFNAGTRWRRVPLGGQLGRFR
jgi:hypothetical protein